MLQQRLNMFTRKVSAEERDYNNKIRSLKIHIRQAKKDLEERLKEYRARVKHQKDNGLQGKFDTPIKEDRINNIISLSEKHIKKLEQDLIYLIRQKGSVQKASSKQGDIFN